jgi:hypothetical protein
LAFHERIDNQFIVDNLILCQKQSIKFGDGFRSKVEKWFDRFPNMLFASQAQLYAFYYRYEQIPAVERAVL